MEFFDTNKLQKHGQTILKLIAARYEDIKELKYPVTPPTEPGDIRNQLPRSPPIQAESEEKIIDDVEKILLPASTYWCHPNFFAYYAQNICHAQVISEIYGTTFSQPRMDCCQTELENLIIDWIIQAMDLPKHFLYQNSGGGVISATASDSVFLTIQAAKKKKQSELQIQNHDPRILNFVGYYSGMCHASSAKGLYFKDIPYTRDIPIKFNLENGNYQADVTAFKKILEKDLEDGLIPFWFGSAWGSTYTCGYDNIMEIGQICKIYGIWLNVDAAYAGSSWIIPEYREKAHGLELVDSIQINFSKMMMTGLAGTITLVKNKKLFSEGIGGEKYDLDEYKDWQIGDEKRFDSLKIWWMMRSNGIEGMRRNILSKVQIAQYFEGLIEQSSRWKIFTKRELSLTTFLLRDQTIDLQNRKNRKLYQMINQETSKGFVNAITVDGVFFLRCVIGSHETTTSHIDTFFSYINELADKLEAEEYTV